MPDLSVLVPARNEQWLNQTIARLLAQRRGDTEVIVVLDGAWPETPILPTPDVQVLYHATSIGQRAATNEAARLSRAKYIMKLDAHCDVDEGFDAKLMAAAAAGDPGWTIIPRMYNLHAFDWQCRKCGTRTYQGPMPTACAACEQTAAGFEQVLVWQPRWSRKSDFWRFDSDLHFQYWGECERRPESHGEIADTMSSIGACFFMARDRFWDLGGLDETHGSWGQFGTEIACKSWLSGGRHVVYKGTWFSHLFRTQPGFQFPYPLSGSAVAHARSYSQDLWRENRWPGQRHALLWLIDKFWPIPGWTDADRDALRPAAVRFAEAHGEECPSAPTVVPVRSAKTTTGICYYSDNRPEPSILQPCQRQLQRADVDELMAVTLAPMPDLTHPSAAVTNLVLNLERGYLTMFKQILAGLDALSTDVVFFCEHDVLYHPSHFAYRPARSDRYYYNQHVWKVDADTGRALFYYCNQTSGLCGDRETLRRHYRRRLELVEAHGFTRAMGFEPGTHRRAERVDDLWHETWMSAQPNIDLRHGANLTPSRWSQDQFRNKAYCQGWTIGTAVPGWGATEGRMPAFLAAIAVLDHCPA